MQSSFTKNPRANQVIRFHQSFFYYYDIVFREEEERCIKFDTKKTDVKQVFETEQHWNTKTIKRHSYIYQEDKICISQEPVIQMFS